MQYQREILDSLRQILRSLRNSSRTAESEMGISGAQLLVLQLLQPGKALSINELAEKTKTHQSSVSIVVSRLVEAKLVLRRPSAEDGRRVEVALTAKGTQLLKKERPVLAQEKLFAAISKMPEAKQKTLSSLLGQLVAEAGFDSEPATLFFEEDPSK